jgi:hypothetical protein
VCAKLHRLFRFHMKANRLSHIALPPHILVRLPHSDRVDDCACGFRLNMIDSVELTRSEESPDHDKPIRFGAFVDSNRVHLWSRSIPHSPSQPLTLSLLSSAAWVFTSADLSTCSHSTVSLCNRFSAFRSLSAYRPLWPFQNRSLTFVHRLLACCINHACYHHLLPVSLFPCGRGGRRP